MKYRKINLHNNYVYMLAVIQFSPIRPSYVLG